LPVCLTYLGAWAFFVTKICFCFSAVLPPLSWFLMIFLTFSLQNTVSAVLLQLSCSWSQNSGRF
jgi:hypothetical protein